MIQECISSQAVWGRSSIKGKVKSRVGIFWNSLMIDIKHNEGIF